MTSIDGMHNHRTIIECIICHFNMSVFNSKIINSAIVCLAHQHWQIWPSIFIFKIHYYEPYSNCHCWVTPAVPMRGALLQRLVNWMQCHNSSKYTLCKSCVPHWETFVVLILSQKLNILCPFQDKLTAMHSHLYCPRKYSYSYCWFSHLNGV